MGMLLVIAIAVAVGVLVFRLTAGGEDRVPEAADPATVPAEGAAWTDDEVGEARPTGAQSYVLVEPGGPSWHARLGGAMGLMIAVAAGAIALALSLWALVNFVARLFSDAGGGSPPPT